jgi:hypothetical protein
MDILKEANHVLSGTDPGRGAVLEEQPGRGLDTVYSRGIDRADQANGKALELYAEQIHERRCGMSETEEEKKIDLCVNCGRTFEPSPTMFGWAGVIWTRYCEKCVVFNNWNQSRLRYRPYQLPIERPKKGA